jgi:hypothetical protein
MATIIPNFMEPLIKLIFLGDDFEYTLTSALLLTIFTCGHPSHLLRAEGHQRHWLYLFQLQLPPNPCIGSLWQFLYQSQLDQAFIITMGIDTTTFQVILDIGFEDFGIQPQSHRLTPISMVSLSKELIP